MAGPGRAREEAEAACQHAEKLFLSGNISGACRHAKKAKRLCPSLPGVDNAVAAYHVHAAAGRGWRDVLGIPPSDKATTKDAIKKEFRRLSLLVHPDKARCAAAEGAFKLVRQACEDALSAGSGSGSGRDRRTSHQRFGTPPRYEPRPAAPEQPKEMRPMYVPQPHEVILVYCPFCKSEYRGKIGRVEQQAGIKCARCPEWLSPPWQKKPPAKKEPPAGPGRQVFQCPAKCPECGAQYTSMVCVGRWCLRCKACSKATMVNVQGPDKATATVTSRA